MLKIEFEKFVADGFERLPQWVREKIENVALLIEDEPSREVREREGLGEGETLLGYYHGIPLTARGEHYGVGATMPDTITVYREPILDAADEELTTSNVVMGDDNDIRCRYEEIVRRIVAETVW